MIDDDITAESSDFAGFRSGSRRSRFLAKASEDGLAGGIGEV